MIQGPRKTVKRARKLRSEMSLPEVLLWSELRKRPGGFKIRRQHSAAEYVLDFYCAKMKLAIEVDGRAHDSAPAALRTPIDPHFSKLAESRLPPFRRLRYLRMSSRSLCDWSKSAILVWRYRWCPSTSLRLAPLPVPGRIYDS